MENIGSKVYKIVCVLVIVLVVGIRLHLADIPFERDEGEYAYAGQMILHGVPPYQEVYNMKFPGVYFMFALAFRLFGVTVVAARYLTLLLQLLGASFIFLLARRIIHPLAGWLAAAAFMLFNLTLAFQGTQSNTEHFVVAFLVPSLCLLYLGMERESVTDIAVSGFLLGCACLMKQHAFIFGIAAVGWVIYMQRLKCLRYLAAYAVGEIVPVMLMFGYLWHAGVWERFYFLTIQYARAYIGVVPVATLMYKMNPVNHDSSAFSILLIWFAVICPLGLFLPKTNNKTRAFLPLLLVASSAAVSPGFYFRRHYFLMTLPLFSLLFANTAFQFSNYFSDKRQYLFLTLFVMMNAAFFIWYDYECFFKLPVEQISEEMYPGSPFALSGAIASYVKQHSQPNDRICVVGVEPQLFFLSQRRSASGYIYIYPLMENQKYAEMMTDEFITRSEQSKPPILVYTSVSIFDEAYSRHEKLFKWFNTFKKQYKLTAISTARNAGDIQLTALDTIAPMDTFNMELPQVRVYERIDK